MRFLDFQIIKLSKLNALQEKQRWHCFYIAVTIFRAILKVKKKTSKHNILGCIKRQKKRIFDVMRNMRTPINIVYTYIELLCGSTCVLVFQQIWLKTIWKKNSLLLNRIFYLYAIEGHCWVLFKLCDTDNFGLEIRFMNSEADYNKSKVTQVGYASKNSLWQFKKIII